LLLWKESTVNGVCSTMQERVLCSPRRAESSAVVKLRRRLGV
jgi:hypothetical protein